MQADFGRTSKDYARHRAGFPAAFFERLLAHGWIAPGERVLDLGTGTGTLARGFAYRGLEVVGLDIAHDLLRAALTLDREAGVAVRYVRARAEATGLQDASFNLVTAGQCWHWFDRPRAAAEAHRLLAPGGCIVIAHFDWLPLPGNVVETTEALIREHNPAWTLYGGTGFYPQWLTDLTFAGFGDLETFSFDHAVRYSHEAWRGRTRASAGIGASLGPAEVARFDAALADLLAMRFPEDPLPVPHRCWAVLGRIT